MFDKYFKCIPMFGSTEDQWLTAEDVVQKGFEKWISFSNYLLPFQVERKKDPATTFTLELIKNGAISETISIPSNNLIIRTGSGIDYIQYLAQHEVSIDCGVYYYHFYDGNNEWFSELFSVKKEKTSFDFEGNLNIIELPFVEIDLSATATNGINVS